MGIAQPAILALNRGLISQLGMARTDLKRSALSASIQTNLMPRMLGSAMIRPGLQYIGSTLGNAKAKMIPFIFSTTDVLLLEATAGALRMWLPGSDGEPSMILSRVAVSAAITNGTFAGSLAGWTDDDQSGAASLWAAGNYMLLTGTGFNAAQQYQQVTVAPGDVGKEHAVRVLVARGTATLNIGTSAGDGTYALNLKLGAGLHSIAFGPTGNFYVHLSNATQVNAFVQSVAIEAAGVVTLPTPWDVNQIALLRWDQSGEVVYVACDGLQQRKIQRWGKNGELGYRSFSIELYQSDDGPFLLENISSTTLTASGTSGAITLTASRALFKPTHAGALFKLASTGQSVSFLAGGANQWSQPIEITGVGQDRRDFTIQITGTFVATVVLQQSIGAPGAWTDVGPVTPGTAGIPSNANWNNVGNASTWTAPIGTSIVYDGQDNVVIYYRIGIEAAYTSGAASCVLTVTSGSITGICRIILVGSPTSATADVLIQPGNTGVLSGLGSTNSTQNWWEGVWSDKQGWPTSVAIHEGRMWWAGRNRILGSVSDAYESFDETTVGDSGPINRTIGSGPVDVINWLLPLADLIAGSQSAEKSVRSSVLGGIITPTDFIMKDASTQGSSGVPAVKVDYNGVFLQRSGRRVYMLNYTPSYYLLDYSSTDLTNFVPDIAIMENGAPLATSGIAWLAVQRQPDTRIHAILNDGTVRVMVLDPAEDEHAWIKVQTAGVVEDCVVLPGGSAANSSEDLVYYVVARTINGATVRYLERWAREDECIGGAVSKIADAHIAGTQAASPTISGLGHLIGQTVVCWADGMDRGTFTVSGSGTITLPVSVTHYCVGIGYTWQFMSSKLAYAAELGTPLLQKKKVTRIGVVAANMHHKAFQYGKNFTTMYDLPQIYKGAPVADGTVYPAFDDETFLFNGSWDTDARVCLQGSAPRPAIILAVVIDMEARERV